MSWLQRLQGGLAKTRQGVQSSLRRLVGGQLDPAVIEDVEASLLQADVGVRTVQRFLDEINSQTGPFKTSDPIEVLRTLLLRYSSKRRNGAIGRDHSSRAKTLCAFNYWN